MTSTDFSDLPISKPEQDVFGIEPFTKSLAKSLLKMERPEGVVVAINGPWGSGKSSALNLLKNHLQPSLDSGKAEIISFNPWWFQGEDSLVLAFFHEIYRALKPNLGKRALKTLPQLASKMLRLGATVAPTSDAFGASGWGSATGAAMGWLETFVKTGESVETLHDELAKSLRKQRKRFIVFIDDIDRLAPDEAFAIFRLIKSVGRLPNITYVLAFDREQAVRAIEQRFTNEGEHYLEKIIQVPFDLPLPNSDQLRDFILAKVTGFIPVRDQQAQKHLLNQFYDIVLPEIQTPRHAIRYLNSLTVTWPAVAGEVNVGDFFAIEAYRLFQPSLHKAIRENAIFICGTSQRDRQLGNAKAQPELADERLLKSVSNKEHYRKGLMRLFPRLESVWNNMNYQGENWIRERRICAAEIFPIYFRLGLPDNVVPMKEIRELISKAADKTYVSDALMKASAKVRSSGTTWAALLLDALNTHAKDIPLEDTSSLLRNIFSVADSIDNAADEAGAFSIGDNRLRIHWLFRSLFRDRTTLEQRSKILLEAAESASFVWLIDLANSAWGQHHQPEGKQKPFEDQIICTEEDAQKLQEMALLKIRDASRDGSLLKSRHLHWLLYRWRDLIGDAAPVKQWTSEQIESDNGAVTIALALISTSWSQSLGFNGLGDRVALRKDYIQVNGLNEIVDLDRLKVRLEEIKLTAPVDSEKYISASRFLAAPHSTGF
jgi:predicted KAP-like P-loop ATPase